MQIYIRRLLGQTLLLFLSVASIPAYADEATERAAVEAASQAWLAAFNAHDADSLVALTTPDVVLMDAGVASVSGRDATRATWVRALAAAKGQVTTSTKEIAIAGDLAWRIGALAHKLPDGTVVSRGQSLEIWKRVNGEWKIHRQMSSGLLAQPKGLSRPPPAEPIFNTPRSTQ